MRYCDFKAIALASCMLLPLGAAAYQNCFADGTVWDQVIYGGQAYDKPAYTQVWIDGTEEILGVDAFKMYRYRRIMRPIRY